MSTENYKEIVRQGFEDGINKRNYAHFDQYVASNYVNHNMPTPEPGPKGLVAVIQTFINAFPDFKVTVEEVLGEGDLVSTRGYFTGTHEGEFNGIPPTGKTIKVNYVDIWRGENGKLVENWVQLDMLALLQQLGVIPAPAPAAA